MGSKISVIEVWKRNIYLRYMILKLYSNTDDTLIVQ